MIYLDEGIIILPSIILLILLLRSRFRIIQSVFPRGYLWPYFKVWALSSPSGTIMFYWMFIFF
jgi:hypothetical protein